LRGAARRRARPTVRQRSIAAFDRRVPASFTVKRRPVTGDLDRQTVDSIKREATNDRCLFEIDFSRTGEAGIARHLFFREIRHRVGRSRR
jgi:hypothetical protein